MIKNIFLVRHAQSLWNVKNIKQCSIDYSLSEVWIQQAYSISLGVQINKLFSSPFQRTKETANIIAKTHKFPLSSIIFDERLREREVFNEKVDYQLTEENRKIINPYILQYPANKKYWEIWESFLDIHQRLWNFLDECVLKPDCENIIIVSHAAAINHLIYLLLFWKNNNSELHYKFFTKFSHIKNASITKMINKNWNFLIDYFNVVDKK